MQFQLSIERLKEIPLNQYDKNFTFIVNGTQYHTCRIIADILSPSICQLHYNDPTINEYYINTSHTGDFQHILNLISYEIYNIQKTEVPFIFEVLEKLNNQMIKIHLSEEITVTKENVIDIISKYENSYIYSSIFTKAIDFISCHFYEIIDDETKKKFHNLKKETIDKIIQNDQLQLESEDQLLSFINDLVDHNPLFIHLYENVDFLNVSPSEIEKFITIFDYNDLTSEIWKQITIRLIQNISIENDHQQNLNHHKYRNKDLPLLYENNKEFQGIFGHIQKKGNIFNEIEITSSPLNMNEETDSPKHAVQFDSEKYFRTANVNHAFICFDFKNRKICPKSYTIRLTFGRMVLLLTFVDLIV